ncbi:MAG TPA: diacylglycerol kinase family protein [Solirubrobacteraceae bacterium]|nr:diacylglycerol kinase family protein [Solirubrobacteraceae bacterium]
MSVLSAPRGLALIVNANASGVDGTRSTLRDTTDRLTDAGGRVRAAHATRSLRELRAALEEAGDQRVVLVGGDGAIHAAANAGGLGGELALIPAGRANNIARASAIPLDRAAAARFAVAGSASPFDVLQVSTPARDVVAVEGVSAGFHAAARSRYRGANSAHLAQGVLALAAALAAYAPYDVELAVDGGELSTLHTAQLFVSNLPLFGFGFPVAPGAAPDDGVADLITLPAPRSRAGVLRELWRVRRAAHLDHAARSRRVRSVEIASPVPLVADAEVLGTGTAGIRLAAGALLLVRGATAGAAGAPARRALPASP